MSRQLLLLLLSFWTLSEMRMLTNKEDGARQMAMNTLVTGTA